jgi:hypothetical protein
MRSTSSSITAAAARVRVIAGILGILSATPAALAFQPLITDDTGTQGAGGNQLELAVNRQRLASVGDTTTTWTAPLVYTRGLTDALDLYAGGSFVRIRTTTPDGDTEGPGNPVLGMKWRAWEDEARGLSIGVKPEIQRGVSDDAEQRGLGTGRTGYGLALLLTQETGFGAIHVNAAADRVRYALPQNAAFHRRNLYRFSVAPVFDVGEHWKLAADAGVTTHPHRPERATMGYALLGGIWSPSKDLDFALGYIAALHDGEQRLRTWTAGVTWRFR